MQRFFVILRLAKRCIEPIAHSVVGVDLWFSYTMLKMCIERAATGDITPGARAEDPVPADSEEASKTKKLTIRRHHRRRSQGATHRQHVLTRQ
jgi:hypothetical protein